MRPRRGLRILRDCGDRQVSRSPLACKPEVSLRLNASERQESLRRMLRIPRGRGDRPSGRSPLACRRTEKLLICLNVRRDEIARQRRMLLVPRERGDRQSGRSPLPRGLKGPAGWLFLEAYLLLPYAASLTSGDRRFARSPLALTSFSQTIRKKRGAQKD